MESYTRRPNIWPMWAKSLLKRVCQKAFQVHTAWHLLRNGFIWDEIQTYSSATNLLDVNTWRRILTAGVPLIYRGTLSLDTAVACINILANQLFQVSLCTYACSLLIASHFVACCFRFYVMKSQHLRTRAQSVTSLQHTELCRQTQRIFKDYRWRSSAGGPSCSCSRARPLLSRTPCLSTISIQFL